MSWLFGHKKKIEIPHLTISQNLEPLKHYFAANLEGRLLREYIPLVEKFLGSLDNKDLELVLSEEVIITQRLIEFVNMILEGKKRSQINETVFFEDSDLSSFPEYLFTFYSWRFKVYSQILSVQKSKQFDSMIKHIDQIKSHFRFHQIVYQVLLRVFRTNHSIQITRLIIKTEQDLYKISSEKKDLLVTFSRNW